MKTQSTSESSRTQELKVNWDQVWAGIDIRASYPDVIPPGWVTARQYCEKHGLAKDTVLKAFHEGVRNGTFEAKRFKVPAKANPKKLMSVLHYRPVVKPKA